MMIRPTNEEWKIYKQVLENHPVYLIAKNYSIEQEKVLEIYFRCMEWKEIEEGTPVYHNYKRRKHTRR